MKLRGAKRIAISLAASAAMVGGLALTAPATASAADRYEGPTLKVTQTSDEKNVTLELTNPNKVDGLLGGSLCTSTLLSGQQGLEALVAFNNGDFVKLLSVIATQGVHVGPAAGNTPVVDEGPNSNSKDVKVGDGVYVFVGTCGGLNSLVPGNVGVSVKPVIVPDGIGSIAPGLAFGSLLLESGDAIMDVLPLLSALS